MAYVPRRDFDRGGRGGGGGGGGGGGDEGGYDNFMKAKGRRPVTDYGATVNHWMRHRLPKYKGSYQGELERPSPSYLIDMLPPVARPTNAADSIPGRWVHQSLNKVKHPVNVVRWTPEGRRLLTASSSGEFTLWNGTAFNFETIMQAHDSAIRALEYSNSDDWLISADHDGVIKYWQPNFNNVESIRGHHDAIRDLAIAPTDSKFVTASDDSTLKIFDFAAGREDTTLTGHGWDAKTCDWHPTKGLVVSGSKDHLVKLWDPRNGRCLSTLHGHKNTVTKVLFERVAGLCLATAGRDQTARVFDLRMMRDICLIRGHDKDVSTLTWHPVHANLLSTGGGDGSLFHYLLDEANAPEGHSSSVAVYDAPDPETAPAQTIYPGHKIPFAHDMAIWSLDWHPLGHILASGSNDRLTRFWTRARPGDTDYLKDQYHIGEAAAVAGGTFVGSKNRRQRQEEEAQEAEDEMEGLEDQKMPLKSASAFPGIGIPGLPLPGTGSIAPPPMIPGVGGSSGPGMPPNLPFPIPPPGMSGMAPPILPPGLDPNNPPDLAKIAEMMQKAGIPLPPPPGSGMAPPPPGMLPPGFIPPPPNSQLPPGFIPPPIPMPGMDAGAAAREAASARRRAPLPSQEESLKMEQKRGHYTRPH
ncbi:hypothetical protein VMCG_06657 [Cytospora schulzeri]|uniref:Polyadenylation factor subunit 2 n=1 Tax=Cytospora schulzeri TaxID=448051 RepID=A0A423W741_9PEZI|nr:hypothetical protein VMCG_06657 [Valsa malicola]